MWSLLVTLYMNRLGRQYMIKSAEECKTIIYSNDLNQKNHLRHQACVDVASTPSKVDSNAGFQACGAHETGPPAQDQT